MKNIKFDKEEKEILKAYEQGELKSVLNLTVDIEKLKESARKQKETTKDTKQSKK